MMLVQTGPRHISFLYAATLFLAIEGIRRKPLNRNVESYVNFVGLMILFAFMIFVTVKDVLNLFV